MLKHFQRGFVGIVIAIIISILAGGAIYYVGTKQGEKNNDEVSAGDEVKNDTSVTVDTNSNVTSDTKNDAQVNTKVVATTSVEANVVLGDNKLYSSDKFGIEFHYPKSWFVHEDAPHLSSATSQTILLTKSATLPSPGMDGDIYGQALYVRINSISTSQAAMTNTQHLDEIRKGQDPFWDEQVKKTGINPVAQLVKINGVEVIQEPWFSELAVGVRVAYYVYSGGKEYKFQSSTNYGSDTHSKQSQADLFEIIGSFKVTK